MNRSWRIVLLATVCGSLILAASAAPVLQAQDNPQSNPQQSQPQAQTRSKLSEWLGLTPEQQSQLDGLRKARQDKFRAAAEEMRKLAGELRALRNDANVDPKKADALIDQMMKLRADSLKSGFRFHQDFDKILTPAQREKLAEMRTRFHGARMGMAGRFRGRFPFFRGRFGLGVFFRPFAGRYWGGLMGSFMSRGFPGFFRWRHHRFWGHRGYL